MKKKAVMKAQKRGSIQREVEMRKNFILSSIRNCYKSPFLTEVASKNALGVFGKKL
jgi:hypothetical protein